MANTTLFGALGSRIVPVQKLFGILSPLGAATPVVIFNAANVVPVNFTAVDFWVANTPVAGQVGATATLTSNLNGAGDVAISDALDISAARGVTRATTFDVVQSILTFGAAVEDTLTIVKHAAGELGSATVLAYLT